MEEKGQMENREPQKRNAIVYKKERVDHTDPFPLLFLSA